MSDESQAFSLEGKPVVVCPPAEDWVETLVPCSERECFICKRTVLTADSTAENFTDGFRPICLYCAQKYLGDLPGQMAPNTEEKLAELGREDIAESLKGKSINEAIDIMGSTAKETLRPSWPWNEEDG